MESGTDENERETGVGSTDTNAFSINPGDVAVGETGIMESGTESKDAISVAE